MLPREFLTLRYFCKVKKYGVNYLFFLQKLAELEAEEAIREQTGMYAVPKMDLTDTMKEIRQLAKQIRDKKIIMAQERAIVKNSTKPVVPRTAPAKARGRSVTRLRSEMTDLGVDMSGTEDVSTIADARERRKSSYHK